MTEPLPHSKSDSFPLIAYNIPSFYLIHVAVGSDSSIFDYYSCHYGFLLDSYDLGCIRTSTYCLYSTTREGVIKGVTRRSGQIQPSASGCCAFRL